MCIILYATHRGGVNEGGRDSQVSVKTIDERIKVNLSRRRDVRGGGGFALGFETESIMRDCVWVCVFRLLRGFPH